MADAAVHRDETLKMLGEKGLGHIQVMCPGFAADCLETLEEIAEQQNREDFPEAGGGKICVHSGAKRDAGTY